MNTTDFIKTENLSKVYATGKIKVAALQEVNLSLPKGIFLGVTGASGSGKSTLMNLLGGLDTPSTGLIQVEGKIISQMSSDELSLYRRVQIGMIFQSFNLIPSLSAVENVALPLFFAGVRKKQRIQQAEQVLEQVGLSARQDHRPAELSGGEQQRVAVARALVNQPNILLADEPTGNLDSKTSREIIQLLAALHRNQNLTVVMISHEQALLKEFADEMIGLQDGKIMEPETIS
jgi:putative ABC transport system ATP-binding protein